MFDMQKIEKLVTKAFDGNDTDVKSVIANISNIIEFMIEQVKKEAVKEFAEKVRQLYVTPEIENINNIYYNVMTKTLNKLLEIRGIEERI